LAGIVFGSINAILQWLEDKTVKDEEFDSQKMFRRDKEFLRGKMEYHWSAFTALESERSGDRAGKVQANSIKPGLTGWAQINGRVSWISLKGTI
jgi:hypothetical protein